MGFSRATTSPSLEALHDNHVGIVSLAHFNRPDHEIFAVLNVNSGLAIVVKLARTGISSVLG